MGCCGASWWLPSLALTNEYVVFLYLTHTSAQAWLKSTKSCWKTEPHGKETSPKLWVVGDDEDGHHEQATAKMASKLQRYPGTC
mmetsp:Transcript_75497/g.137970  ORF Transcript_75497/g.137970 Transcript_75497/m.137970 type:complete len:84 (-) Transcript_75497:555-806(-)